MMCLTPDRQAVQLQRILAGMGPKGGAQGGSSVETFAGPIRWAHSVQRLTVIRDYLLS